MTLKEMREFQRKSDPSQPVFWVIECTAILDSIRRTVQEKSRQIVDGKKRKQPEKELRVYYATEFIPSYPAKLDRVSRFRPKDGNFQHTVRATSVLEATKLIEDKLNKERLEKANEENREDDITGDAA
jgi:hypothetical protein